MFKQSHSNLGCNFNSSVADGQSGPPATNGTDGIAEQEGAVAGAIPTYVVLDMSKKEKSPEEVPPVDAEEDKSKKKKEKKKIGDKNHYETLHEPKKVCISIFLI